MGHEYGATTGRERRCGWLDLVALRYAVRLNGMTGLVVTKIDVLNDLDEIKVCTAYRYQGELLTEMPLSQSVFHHVEPVYETFRGWKTDISGIRDLADLPTAAREYLAVITEGVGVPAVIVSVGPHRDQTIRVA